MKVVPFIYQVDLWGHVALFGFLADGYRTQREGPDYRIPERWLHLIVTQDKSFVSLGVFICKIAKEFLRVSASALPVFDRILDTLLFAIL